MAKSSGVSDKSGSSGGSFGIGKSAPFVCSDFRTVIYSTFDCEGVSASQGVARLVSFENTNSISQKYVTQGIGYYGNTEDNSPIPEMMSIGKYVRTESGTDLYILGFTDNSEWEDDIINAILDGFLISIINGDLIIRIENQEINRNSLSEYIDKYKDTAQLAYNYYQVLTSDKTVVFRDDFKGLGNIKLMVLLDSELKRRVLVTRKNGMKILDKDRISGTIFFAGVLILEDEKINAYFREMETPQHDDWQPMRHTRPAEAKRYKNELFRWVKNNIIELGREAISDETDAEGVGDYLPDEVLLETSDEKNNKAEVLENVTKNIEITEIKNIIVKKGTQQNNSTGMEGQIEIPGFYDEEADDSIAFVPGKTMNDKVGGLGKMVPGREDENGSNKVNKNISIKPMYMRLFTSDYEKNEYTLSFLPEYSAKNAYVKISFAGEQTAFKIPVKSAKSSGIELKTNKNKILIGDITENSKVSIKFEIDYEDACSMEVCLYGTKV